MCTRCIRFCDEVTKTSELGLLNRGDRTVIAVNPGKELDNPLSGTVVDLCPVGALTHRNWRFNSRIWYSNQYDSICTGCSTGCNVKVAIRDNQVVQVKARLNEDVNKEWLCDEGRYGFGRFQPSQRITTPSVKRVQTDLDKALDSFKSLRDSETLVFVSPDLTLEEYWILKKFLDRDIQKFSAVVAYRERSLSEVEKVLISPDYASNFRGAQLFGLAGEDPQSEYEEALVKLKSGSVERILCVGDRSILVEDRTKEVASGISGAAVSIGILSDSSSIVGAAMQVVIPERTCLEKAGLMVNRKMRLQYVERLLNYPQGVEPTWKILNLAAQRISQELVSCSNDRDLTLRYLQSDSRLSKIRIADLKNGGVLLTEISKGDRRRSQMSAGAA